jgi:hypothetical protein
MRTLFNENSNRKIRKRKRLIRRLYTGVPFALTAAEIFACLLGRRLKVAFKNCPEF